MRKLKRQQREERKRLKNDVFSARCVDAVNPSKIHGDDSVEVPEYVQLLDDMYDKILSMFNYLYDNVDDKVVMLSRIESLILVFRIE